MADVIVDPDVPDEDARLLRQNGPLLARIRRGWVPEPKHGMDPDRLRALKIVLAGTFAFMMLLTLVRGWVGGLGLILGAVGVVVLITSLIRRDLESVEVDEDAAAEQELYEQARWYDGRYILVGDLDESSQRLLARARRSIYAVLGSRVNLEGMLDDVRNAVFLPAEEWQIARLLDKLSSLRAKHRETVSKGLTPEVAAVAEPLAKALDNSEDAVVARVEALERYATHVADAERAYLAHHQIEELRGRLHQYEELVAESGADGFAVPEMDRLAADADQLEQALRRSVRSAHEAFRHLDPPEDPPEGLPEDGQGKPELDG